MGFILSCSTIPTRLDNLIKLIPTIKCKYKYLVINLCTEYKRFGKFKIPRSLLLLCNRDKRIVFNFQDDNGPLTKYIGGFNFMKKKKLINDKLIIIDDDIFYDKDLFYDLIDEKKSRNITGGSGFNFYIDGNYKPSEHDCDFLEGYGAICFDYNQYSDFLFWYSGFYRHFIFKGESVIDKYLTASFLGDDYIISNAYDNKYAIESGRKYIKPLDYGFNDEALHKNNVFGTNMGTYKYLNDNRDVFKTFKNKFNLLQEIKGHFIKSDKQSKISDKQNIQVITWYDDNIKSYADITTILNDKYCKSIGIDFKVHKSRRCPKRHPSWESIYAIYHELSNPTIRWDWIVWIDADAVFNTNSQNKLIDIINDYRDYDIIHSFDYPYSKGINCGFYMVKNNNYMTKYFKMLIDDADDKYFNTPNWEQEKMNKFYNLNIMDIQNHSCILSHRKMQDFYDLNNDACIFHMAGQDTLNRILKFSERRERNICDKIDEVNINFDLDELIYYDENDKLIDHKNIENIEQDLCLKYINSNDVVLELGARYGTVSILTNKIIDDKLNHYVVEPDNTVWKSLEDNMIINDCNFNIIRGIIGKTGYKLIGDGYAKTSIPSDDNNNIYDIPNVPFNTLIADCEGYFEKFYDENSKWFETINKIILECDMPHKCNYTRVIKELLNLGFNIIKNINHHGLLYLVLAK